MIPEGPLGGPALREDLSPGRRGPWFGGTLPLLALLLLFGLVSGVVGAMTYKRFLVRPSPALHIGVVNLTRLTQAVTGGVAQDPALGAAFAPRFEGAIKRLTEADPDLILLVKEAVIAGGPIEDFTDALLPLFTVAPLASPQPVTPTPTPSPVQDD